MNVFLRNARARNTHFEATLNHPFPAQVSVSVESNLAVRGGYLAGLVPDSLSPYATRERERRALVIPRRRGKTP